MYTMKDKYSVEKYYFDKNNTLNEYYKGRRIKDKSKTLFECSESSTNWTFNDRIKSKIQGNKTPYTDFSSKNYISQYNDRIYNHDSLRDMIISNNHQLYSTKYKPSMILPEDRKMFEHKHCITDVRSSSNYSKVAKSDIFNVHPVDRDVQIKSGEKSLFTYAKKNFDLNSVSNSSWVPTLSRPTLINHSKIEYNILNPLTKSRSSVYSNIQHIDKLTHRQKAICEFEDITSNGSPKLNREYLKIVKNQSQPFNKIKNICSDFSSMSHNYKSLCGPAFTLKKEQ